MKSIVAAVFSIMLATFSIFALAAEIPFNQAQFDAARAAGKPVAVVFHADWCPTCRAQAPLLKELAAIARVETRHPVRCQFRHREGAKKVFRGDPAEHDRRFQGWQGERALDWGYPAR